MCKRLLLLIGLLLATANARAEEFVDPWFNEPLQPLSNQTWRTVLTPNLTTADTDTGFTIYIKTGETSR